MGVTKNDIFTTEQNDLSAIAKALGHPARIAIIQKLIESKTCICGDLVDDIGLAQATISQHLKELKSSGLIKGNVEGTSVCYCFDLEKLESFKSTLNVLFDDAIAASKTCC